MKPFGLKKQFENYQQMSDIPARARRTEVIHWLGLLLSFLMLLLSADMILQQKQHFYGMVMLLIAIIFAVFIKLWAHIRIAAYQIIKEIQLQQDKSEAIKS